MEQMTFFWVVSTAASIERGILVLRPGRRDITRHHTQVADAVCTPVVVEEVVF